MRIFWCEESHIDWVNQQYQKIDFKPSSLATDQVAIAEVEGKYVGLGRLCRIDTESLELGGMHVDPSHRNQGIARKIVQFLLASVSANTNVYCLPFAHLQKFYAGEGFEEVLVEEVTKVPEDVLEKHRWCNKTYAHKVLLLKMQKKKEPSDENVSRA